MKTLNRTLFVLSVVMLLIPVLPAQNDAVGSKDHPLFTRMSGYYIERYEQRDFDQILIEGKDAERFPVEGRTTHIIYQIKPGAALASPIQIARNYQNAIKKIGGTIIYEHMDGVGGATTMKLVRGADEIWARIEVGDAGQTCVVDVVEKSAMKQEITANADIFRDDIRTTGHAAVYGIYFDTDKSVVKPESEAALKEIAKLLQTDPGMSVQVVGHTDGTGDLAHNMALSEARAKAVVEALTTRHGVAASRLTGHGVGPLAPVASNDSEEGRAMNRRVELVKKPSAR